MQSTEIQSFQIKEEIEELVQAFILKKLPIEKWTHQAHLTVAIWHLLNHTKEEAIYLLRCRIITYNESVGTINSTKGGYHETITLFWIWVIDIFLKRNQGNILELTHNFLKSKYADKNLLLKFYSKQYLFSIQSRACWNEPDLMELDFEKI